jgi:hypothetical protein
MFNSTVRGISLDTFATIASDCSMTAEVRGPEVQLELGPRNSLLNVVTDIEGLRKLSALINDVVIRCAAAADGPGLDLRVSVASASCGNGFRTTVLPTE